MPPPDHAESFSPRREVSRQFDGRTRANRRATYQEIQGLAREFGEAAVHTLAYLAAHSQDERIVLLACNSLLDRGYGRPPDSAAGQEIPLQRELEGPVVDITPDLGAMSESELNDRLQQALRKVNGVG